MADLDIAPPQSLEAEQQCLGWLLSGDKRGLEVLKALVEKDFYREAHRMIFCACAETFLRVGTCRVETVMLTLRHTPAPVFASKGVQHLLDVVGGREYLQAVNDRRGPFAGLCIAIRDVRSCSDARALIAACGEAQQALYQVGDASEHVTNAVGMLHGALSSRGEAETLQSLDARLPDFAEWHDALLAADGVHGARFGIPAVDEAIGGLDDHLLVVLKGLPKFGKSSLAVQAAVASAIDFASSETPRDVLVYPLEDETNQFMRRVLSHVGGIDNTSLRRGAYRTHNRERLHERIQLAREALRTLPIWVDGDTRDVDALCTKARVHAMQRRVGLVVIDYVQLVQGGGRGPREERIVGIVERLESLTKELHCPLLLTSQTTVAEDGSLQSKNARAPDEKATLSLAIMRGPVEWRAMAQDQRRRSNEVYLLNTHARRGECFGPVRMNVAWAQDRWEECETRYEEGDDGRRL